GSILEDTILQLDSLDKLNRLDNPHHFGATIDEKFFNVSLELSITWINRILFLKLLEAQLISYTRPDKTNRTKPVQTFAFLNAETIKNYDDLNSLFFQVLARKYEQRHESVQAAFANVPYLNSSLFEPTNLEQACFMVTQLNNNATLPIFSQSVLKDDKGKK